MESVSEFPTVEIFDIGCACLADGKIDGFDGGIELTLVEVAIVPRERPGLVECSSETPKVGETSDIYGVPASACVGATIIGHNQVDEAPVYSVGAIFPKDSNGVDPDSGSFTLANDVPNTLVAFIASEEQGMGDFHNSGGSKTPAVDVTLKTGEDPNGIASSRDDLNCLASSGKGFSTEMSPIASVWVDLLMDVGLGNRDIGFPCASMGLPMANSNSGIQDSFFNPISVTQDDPDPFGCVTREEDLAMAGEALRDGISYAPLEYQSSLLESLNQHYKKNDF